MTAPARKTSKKTTAAEQAALEARSEKVNRIQVLAGLVIVSFCAVAGFFVNPAVGVGFALLVILRLVILLREIRRQKQEGDKPSDPPERSHGKGKPLPSRTRA